MTLNHAADIYSNNLDTFAEPCILEFRAIAENSEVPEPVRKAAEFLTNFVGSFGIVSNTGGLHEFLLRTGKAFPGPRA